MPTGHPGTKAEHGTITRYISHACRCDLCKDAHRVYYGHRPLDVYLAEVAAQHGSVAMYRSGCRCDDCRAAHTQHCRDYRSKRAAA